MLGDLRSFHEIEKMLLLKLYNLMEICVRTPDHLPVGEPSVHALGVYGTQKPRPTGHQPDRLDRPDAIELRQLVVGSYEEHAAVGFLQKSLARGNASP
jgi:hypothetical protein